MNSYKLPMWAALVSFVFWFSLYFALYFAGWPGEAHPCVNPPYCFCETVHQGTLAAQKSNTWSDLGFVLAAFFIAWSGWKTLKTDSTRSKDIYRHSPGLIALYSSVILFMGPGSMFFHGAMTTWGGMMDVCSMYLFVLFLICYLIQHSWHLGERFFYSSYFISCLVFILIAVFTHDLSSKIFPAVAALLITLALLQSIPLSKINLARKTSNNFESRWLAYALGFFIVAVVIWRLSDSGQPFCEPDSLLQGHAAWHLLSACMTVCVHFYLMSEKRES